MAVIDAARHLAGIKDASSSEFGECDTAVVGLMTEWAKDGGSVERRSDDDDLGGTMRLAEGVTKSQCVVGLGARRRDNKGRGKADRGNRGAGFQKCSSGYRFTDHGGFSLGKADW